MTDYLGGDEPTGPDPAINLYLVWQRLATASRDLESFNQGNRDPRALRLASQAVDDIRTVELELQRARLAVGDALRSHRGHDADTLADVLGAADRPELPPIPPSPAPVASLGLPDVGGVVALGAMQRRWETARSGSSCYSCGHPQGAHAGGGTGGCGTIVEHGYPCDCPQFRARNASRREPEPQEPEVGGP